MAGWIPGILLGLLLAACLSGGVADALEQRSRGRVGVQIMALAWSLFFAVALLTFEHAGYVLIGDAPGQIVWIWGSALLLCLMAFIELVWGRFFRRLVPWYQASETSVLAIVLGLTKSLVVLTAAFIGLTALLLHYDAHAASTVGVDGHFVPTRVADDDTVLTVGRYYLWNLLDAIPALKVPETLNWKLEVDLTDSWAGGILLAFKIVAIVPILRGVFALVEQAKERNATPRVASGSSLS